MFWEDKSTNLHAVSEIPAETDFCRVGFPTPSAGLSPCSHGTKAFRQGQTGRPGSTRQRQETACFSSLGSDEEMFLAPRRPVMLLNILQGTGRPHYKELSCPKDSREIEMPCSKEDIVTTRRHKARRSPSFRLEACPWSKHLSKNHRI